jgi:hypothetical protein
MKMGNFSLHNRKSSPYFPRKELHSEINRKISAYFKVIKNDLKQETPHYRRFFNLMTLINLGIAFELYEGAKLF